jgi:hypothetical protein
VHWVLSARLHHPITEQSGTRPSQECGDLIAAEDHSHGHPRQLDAVDHGIPCWPQSAPVEGLQPASGKPSIRHQMVRLPIPEAS